MTVRAPITLTATGRLRLTRLHTVDLKWAGASGARVVIYRTGTKLTTTANDGAHTHAMTNTGTATYRYRLCETVGSRCSPEVTVTF